MSKSEHELGDWSWYYTQEYFSGEGKKSPYPKDKRYLDNNHPVIQRKFKDLYLEIKKHEPIMHDGELKILDLGCGPGHTQAIFEEIDPTINVVNSDGYFEVCEMAVELGRDVDRMVNADIRSLPCIDNSFGVVCLWDVLEHIPEEQARITLKESHRVLDEGGVMAIRTPNKYTWTDKYRKDSGHLWFPTVRGLKQMLIETGFESDGIDIKTRGFPGTSLHQSMKKEGDLYLSHGGGVILAFARKPKE